jgi:hypothetical protein
MARLIVLLGPIASACSAVVLGALFEWALAQFRMFARFVAAGGELAEDDTDRRSVLISFVSRDSIL